MCMPQSEDEGVEETVSLSDDDGDDEMELLPSGSSDSSGDGAKR